MPPSRVSALQADPRAPSASAGSPHGAARGAPKAEEGGALAGIRVLDLTNVLSGPFCAYLLGQLGADVIKIEVPGHGDLARQLGADSSLNSALMGASFLAQNGGKRSATVNLKAPAGREVLLRLIATADVMVENFRPGVMARLGLGYEVLKVANPRLIYCAISGFGQDGPMKDAPAYDQIIQGLSGMMSITGSTSSAPLRVGYPIADTLGGITGAFAIAAALVRRGTSGAGAFIDVSMLDTALASMGWVVSNYLIAGQQPVPMGNDNFTAAPSGTFATGDGMLNIAANKQEQFETLARIIGRESAITDPRFATREARKINRQAVNKEVEVGLRSRSAAEWEATLTAAGVPAGRVLTVPEALRTVQVQQRGLLQAIQTDHDAVPQITVTRAGFRLSGGDPVVSSAPPALGQHTDEILRELGYDPGEIESLRAKGVV